MVAPPATRRLKILAFDPSLSGRLDTVGVNQLTAAVKWEEPLLPGPVGEYVEVVDFDPASGVFYEPVDLNHPYILAQDGLAPSESAPQFHQQMVYAVAMTTIRHFERALGRAIFWSDHTARLKGGNFGAQFVRRLRIYPHALRDRNAYYSPAKKAILFGYFPVTSKDSYNVPGTVVFSCLSHDIIVHEVTHALLDGVHPRFSEATNPDVHAFHEAFADLVAIFQHFSYPSVLEHQLSRTRGALDTENLLSQLAQQFGRATGRGQALRDALGGIESGVWKPKRPDPHALARTVEPHERGAILVAAVFRAFLLIYRARTADLFRLATGGTGVLPVGEIHPDLTKRLASEAARFADRVLQMCIRAIDYCPPVNITLGAYLRALITADLEFNLEDEGGFRTAFIESFREWGIHPTGIRSVGVDALAWPRGEDLLMRIEATAPPGADPSQTPAVQEAARKDLLWRRVVSLQLEWTLDSDRFTAWKASQEHKRDVWEWLQESYRYGEPYADVFGLVMTDSEAAPTVSRNERGEPAIEVHSVRPATRRTILGHTCTDLVVEITQRRRGYFDRDKQKRMDSGRPGRPGSRGDFWYRAGCTVLIDMSRQEVRRVIRTPGDINDSDELERVRMYLCGESGVSGNQFDAGLMMRVRSGGERDEPFGMLHREEEGDDAAANSAS